MLCFLSFSEVKENVTKRNLFTYGLKWYFTTEVESSLGFSPFIYLIIHFKYESVLFFVTNQCEFIDFLL